jgi:hypothetical protein
VVGRRPPPLTREISDIDDVYGDRVRDVDRDDTVRRDRVHSGVNEGLEHGERD